MTNDVKTEEAQRLESIQEFNAKVHEARLNVSNPPKSGSNPRFNYKFATYDGVKNAVDSTCKPLGLKYFQHFDHESMRAEAVFKMTGKLLLKSYVKDNLNHEYEMGEILVTLFDDPQKFGSELTYKRRYLAMLDWDLVGEDDDGNAAANTYSQTQEISPQDALESGLNPHITEQENLKRYWGRVNELIKQAVKAGVKPEGISSYIEAHHEAIGHADKEGNLYYSTDSNCTLDEIVSIGNYVKELIENMEELGGTK